MKYIYKTLCSLLNCAPRVFEASSCFDARRANVKLWLTPGIKSRKMKRCSDKFKCVNSQNTMFSSIPALYLQLIFNKTLSKRLCNLCKSSQKSRPIKTHFTSSNKKEENWSAVKIELNIISWIFSLKMLEWKVCKGSSDLNMFKNEVNRKFTIILLTKTLAQYSLHTYYWNGLYSISIYVQCTYLCETLSMSISCQIHSKAVNRTHAPTLHYIGANSRQSFR